MPREPKATTKLNKTVSEEAINNFGVPQGLILGALLLILLIYKWHVKNIGKMQSVLYPDDTLIYTVAKSDRECQYSMKCDIQKINGWLKWIN